MDRVVPNAMLILAPGGALFQQRVGDNVFHPQNASMKLYRGFPSRLRHEVPSWVEDGSLFHIRIALDRHIEQRPLTEPQLAKAILDSASLYQSNLRWHITLLVLMPDHLHALLSFPRDDAMSEIIRDWKRFHARTHGVTWQEGYFDHRLRDDERGEQLAAKMNYIRQNPVAAGLCANVEEWPWLIGRSRCPNAMPKPGAEGALLTTR